MGLKEGGAEGERKSGEKKTSTLWAIRSEIGTYNRPRCPLIPASRRNDNSWTHCRKVGVVICSGFSLISGRI
ncbi:unnamed protein product [Hymenolepis diminuta]|uniref:Uncharacterized protein n=1 Tax=Hymenolepis diminuta TaxID=6216 RepID=A0A0R3SHR8_HYMDI|nr:unnamed protein product [Hymenolepis diminuta]